MTGSLCLFGGAFDPPHVGHRAVVEACLEQLPVERVVVMPTAHHPFKGQDFTADAELRLRLCRLAFAGVPGVEVSDLECAEGGEVHYTVDTLRRVRAGLPAGAELFFVIGSDNVADLPRWREHGEVMRLARLVVVPRPGSRVDRAALADIDGLTAAQREALLRDTLRVRPSPASSTAVRAALRAGRPTEGLLEPEVAREIERTGAYREGP